ncbi:DEBR0S7_00430g1_1 [Brettanomyces bruxellensis]|uniref:DEBR0S7_00430g1_1 n=1 Tax=Dekkera bruxellensis TaxID=5007 RepID=A0A7D9H4V4_DEKBR|nr:DEBR0S7_00430g1_1 [Brettanomyces bruxellensis]
MSLNEGLKDLSVIDSILLNLASIQNLCEFEYDKLGTFMNLMDQYHSAKLDTPELNKDHDIFNREFAKTRKFYQDRRNYLKKRSNDLEQDIKKRKLAKEKLVALFESLKNIDSLNAGSGDEDSKKEVSEDNGLPVMNIREQLDEEGNVIKSEVKPYSQSKNNLFSKAFSSIHKSEESGLGDATKEKGKKEGTKKEQVKKDELHKKVESRSKEVKEAINKQRKERREKEKERKEKKKKEKKEEERKEKVLHKLPKEAMHSAKTMMNNAKSPKQVISDENSDVAGEKNNVDDSIHPYTIREEVDEDGNIVRSSVRKLPSMQSKKEKKKTNKNDKDEELSDDQISELLADMDSKRPRPKIEELDDENEKESKENEKESRENEKKNKEMENESKEKKKESKEKEKESKEKEKEKKRSKSNQKQDLKTEKNKIKKENQKGRNLKVNSSMYNPEIDPDDLLTLEVIADEVDDQKKKKKHGSTKAKSKKGRKEKLQVKEEEGEQEQETDNDDDDDGFEVDDSNGIASMVPPESRDYLFRKIRELRISRQKDVENTNEDGKQNIEADIKVRVDKRANSMDDTKAEVKEKVVKTSKEGKSAFKSKIGGDKKKARSVHFSQDVDVKEVEDIWDDLREAEQQGGHPKVSRFKVFMKGEKALDEEEKKKSTNRPQKKVVNGLLVGDVKEHNTTNSWEKSSAKIEKEQNGKSLFDESEAELTSEEILVKDRLKPEPQMMKLGGKKQPTKSQLDRVAKLGLQMHDNHAKGIKMPEIPVVKVSATKKAPGKSEGLKSLKKKDFRSLKPVRKVKVVSSPQKGRSTPISIPRDPNPVNPNAGYGEEDFDFVREQIDNEENGEQDADKKIDEASQKETEMLRHGIEKAAEAGKKVKLTKKQAEKLISNLKGAKLDYRSVGNDLDTMARAYVLGMYDDDIEANNDVIEELKDFKQHNKIVEEMDEKSQKEEKDDSAEERSEEEKKEEDAPLLKDTVVEHDPSEMADHAEDNLDVEFNSDNLNRQVSLDYARMRERMIHKYNGGFGKTKKEREFEPLDEEPRVSRFKAARLGM